MVVTQNPNYLTVRQFAVRFHKSLMTVYHAIWAGRVPSVYEGGRWYLDIHLFDQDGHPLKKESEDETDQMKGTARHVNVQH